MGTVSRSLPAETKVEELDFNAHTLAAAGALRTGFAGAERAPTRQFCRGIEKNMALHWDPIPTAPD
jgi:hypothetical protein